MTHASPRRPRNGPIGPTLVHGLTPGGRKRTRRDMWHGEYRKGSSIVGPPRRDTARRFHLPLTHMAETHRIVVAKPGLDGHDRGAKIVARALRDAGYEVIYTGLHQTPEQIAETAIQEDADAVGLSCHSGAHMTLFPKVVQLLRDQGAEDIVVFGGGIIPREDIPKLKGDGIEEIFTTGTPTREIVEWLRGRLARKAS